MLWGFGTHVNFGAVVGWPGRNGSSKHGLGPEPRRQGRIYPHLSIPTHHYLPTYPRLPVPSRPPAHTDLATRGVMAARIDLNHIRTHSYTGYSYLTPPTRPFPSLDGRNNVSGEGWGCRWARIKLKSIHSPTHCLPDPHPTPSRLWC